MGTTLIRYRKRGAGRRSYPIDDAATIAIGDYVVINAEGEAVEAADTAAFVPVGLAIGFSDKDSADGTDTGDTSADRPPEVEVDSEHIILEGLTVTGAANQADVNALVYVTAAQTYTLTPTANLPAIGEVVAHISGTSVDVAMFSADAMSASR